MRKKILERLTPDDVLRKKYEADDRAEYFLVLKRMSEGAHLYVGDQPYGPDSDVNAWTANLGVSDAFDQVVMGRYLRKMQERHWIRYDRARDEFLLTDDGRAIIQQNELNSASDL